MSTRILRIRDPRALALAGIALLLLPKAVRAADPPEETPIMNVPKCAHFEVSGRGDNPAWDNVAWTELHRRPRGQHEYTARVRMLYSDRGVYVHFNGTDRVLTATMTEDFQDLWNEDVFECFFWPDEDHSVYFEYEISPLNHELPILVPNLDGRFLGWRPWHYEGSRQTVHRVATSGGDNRSLAAVDDWSAEVFIPWDLLKPLHNVPAVSGTRWRANFYRVDYDDEQVTGWDWARVGPSFHEFRSFGTLAFQ